MDINTPKGQESLRQEQEFLDYLKSKYVTRTIIQTPKRRASACDGFIVRGNEITAIFESKCRNLSYDELFEFQTWLVTHEKIEKCRLLSEYLQVPFLGFLYLLKEKAVLMWQITDSEGKYLFDFEVKNTLTQYSINGGEINRDNAYLPIDYAKKL